MNDYPEDRIMSFKKGDFVRLLRDINRIDPTRRDDGFQPYAKKGDLGVIIEVFSNSMTPNEPRWYAKVQSSDTKAIWTLRLASIEKIKR